MLVCDATFSIDKAKFDGILQDVIDNESNGSIKWESEEQQTMQGKPLQKYTISKTGDENINVEFVVEFNGPTNELVFNNMKLRSYNNSWIKDNTAGIDASVKGTYEDPSLVFSKLFMDSAIGNGTFVSVNNSGLIISIIEGEPTDSGKLCVVVDKTVYGASEGASIDDGSFGSTQRYQCKLPSWLNEKKVEDINISKILASTTNDIDARMRGIAKYLVMLKLQGALTTSDFRDLFMQCGVMCNNFSGDNTLTMIYKLFA